MDFTKFLNQDVDFDEDVLALARTSVFFMLLHFEAVGIITKEEEARYQKDGSLLMLMHTLTKKRFRKIKKQVKKMRALTEKLTEDAEEALPKIAMAKGTAAAQAFMLAANDRLVESRRAYSTKIESIEDKSSRKLIVRGLKYIQKQEGLH